MGYVNKNDIKAAGDWLIEQLTHENPLKYSQLWGKTVGQGKNNEDDCQSSFLVSIDCAVAQLVEQGLVTRRWLAEALPEDPDNKDYEVFYTWKKLDAKPEYQHMTV